MADHCEECHTSRSRVGRRAPGNGCFHGKKHRDSSASGELLRARFVARGFCLFRSGLCRSRVLPRGHWGQRRCLDCCPRRHIGFSPDLIDYRPLRETFRHSDRSTVPCIRRFPSQDRTHVRCIGTGSRACRWTRSACRTSHSGSLSRTGLPALLTSAVYDGANRLSSWDNTSYTYDANGNLQTDGKNTYNWNARNQLSSIVGAVSGSFQYDPFGRRVGKTINSVTTNYLYDGANIVQELSGGIPTASLLTGGIDDIFARTDSATTSSLLTDALGSAVGITDSNGTIKTQYTYEPFGASSLTGAA